MNQRSTTINQIDKVWFINKMVNLSGQGQQ